MYIMFTLKCVCGCCCFLLRSVARKMGAAVFCTWEDINSVRPKMIMMFLASVMLVDQRLTSMSSIVEGDDDDE